MQSIEKLWDKYREIISYLFWGVMTTLINYCTYFICTKAFHWHYILGNIIAWTIGVIFAFFVNKLFVFQSKEWEYKIAFRELGQFVFARIFSGVLETAILIVFVDALGFDDSIIKIIAGVVVVIVNYIFSKFLVFRGKVRESE